MIWKLIRETNNKYYYASEEGEVKSVSKTSGKERLIKQSKNSSGYLTFYCKGPKLAHREIAKAFLGEVEGKTVNHKDFDKTNNKISNLELMSYSENIQHAFDNCRNPTRGSSNRLSILTEAYVSYIRTNWDGSREFVQKQAEFSGTSMSYLLSVLNATKWKHVPERVSKEVYSSFLKETNQIRVDALNKSRRRHNEPS